MTDLLNVDLTDITGFLGATAALGTAACGLVDTTKLLGGGISNAGFGHVKRGLKHFLPAIKAALGEEWSDAFRGPWINGVAQDTQVAKAKSVIHLGLSVDNARGIAKAIDFDANSLETIVASLTAGTALTPDQQAALNRFDSITGTIIEAAYERGDQYYRNASKALAGLFAVVLALVGGTIIYVSAHANHFSWGYFGSTQCLLAIVVGAVAVPLAPIAKDLASSISAAVKAVQSTEV